MLAVPADFLVNSLECRSNYSAISNDMQLVQWLLIIISGLLHLVERGGDWAGPQPALQAPPRCTKCNSSPINGQCTYHRIAV